MTPAIVSAARKPAPVSTAVAAALAALGVSDRAIGQVRS